MSTGSRKQSSIWRLGLTNLAMSTKRTNKVCVRSDNVISINRLLTWHNPRRGSMVFICIPLVTSSLFLQELMVHLHTLVPEVFLIFPLLEKRRRLVYDSCSPLRSCLTALSCGQKSRKTSGTRVRCTRVGDILPACPIDENRSSEDKPYDYTLCSLSAFWLAKSPLLILRIHVILWTSMIIV